MNTKDKKEVADIVAEALKAIMSAKKADVPTEEKKQSVKGKTPSVKPKHTRDDILPLLKEMSKDESIQRFGFLNRGNLEKPYFVSGASVKLFYKEYNIVQNEKWKPSFNKEHVHAIIMTQLQGETKQVFQAVKKNCLKFAEYRLTHIPDETIFHKPMTDKQRDNIETAWKLEIGRWSREKQ